MATERRTDEQREQQQTVLDYVTDGGCDLAGLSDTRLGDDATETCRMARGIEARARGEASMKTFEGLDANQRARARLPEPKSDANRRRSTQIGPDSRYSHQTRVTYVICRGSCGSFIYSFIYSFIHSLIHAFTTSAGLRLRGRSCSSGLRGVPDRGSHQRGAAAAGEGQVSCFAADVVPSPLSSSPLPNARSARG